MQKTFSRVFLFATALGCVSLAAHAAPEEYVIDTAGAHASIQFRISHMGFSWLYGRFDKFEGHFTYDPENPANNKVAVTIDTPSIDTFHAERDEHLRNADYLNTGEFPKATFVSTSFEKKGDGKAELKGDLTLHGVTKPIVLQVDEVGHGPDPWGGYRRGFEGRTTLKPADFGINYDLGPAARTVDMTLSVEGIRK